MVYKLRRSATLRGHFCLLVDLPLIQRAIQARQSKTSSYFGSNRGEEVVCNREKCSAKCEVGWKGVVPANKAAQCARKGRG